MPCGSVHLKLHLPILILTLDLAHNTQLLPFNLNICWYKKQNYNRFTQLRAIFSLCKFALYISKLFGLIYVSQHAHSSLLYKKSWKQLWERSGHFFSEADMKIYMGQKMFCGPWKLAFSQFFHTNSPLAVSVPPSCNIRFHSSFCKLVFHLLCRCLKIAFTVLLVHRFYYIYTSSLSQLFYAFVRT